VRLRVVIQASVAVLAILAGTVGAMWQTERVAELLTDFLRNGVGGPRRP
jgi:hypothetical protein